MVSAPASAPLGARFARRLSTPRAISITIPLLVLVTGLLVAYAGRTAVLATINVFAEARLRDQATSLVAYLDHSLKTVDPVLSGLEQSLRSGTDDLELELTSRLVDRPWLRWLAVSLEDGGAVGVAHLPGGDGYEFAKRSADGRLQSWHVRPDGSRESIPASRLLSLDQRSTAWQAVRSDRPAWFWTEIRADPALGSAIINRVHEAVVDGRRLRTGAAIDLRLLPGLQRQDILAEGMVAIALLDDQGRVLVERDRVPRPPGRDLTLTDPALRAASTRLAAEGMRGPSRVLDVEDRPVRAYARRLPSLTGRDLVVIAVADESDLRAPAADFLVHSVVIELAATAVAVMVAMLYAGRLVRAGRELRAERQRADAAEHLADELGAYRLTHLVGRGGMGEVWAAEHRLLARPAAIKLIGNPGDNPDRTHARFMREARLMAALRCPHTVQLYDFGTTSDGCPYYAMELLEGIDLESLVLAHGPLSPPRVAQILIQICESLAEAHDHGLVHRDIKPSNVLLCRMADQCDYVKVLDFGIAAVRHAPGDHAAGDKTHEDGRMLIAGTPGFMAPEQAEGGALDGRADIYALGCVAWWLLNGRPVFPMTGSSTTIIERHASDPLPPLQAALGIPFVLEDLIRRCLAKEPSGRPADARSLGRALQAALHLMEPWTADDARDWWEERLPYPRSLRPSLLRRHSGIQEPSPIGSTQTLIVTSFLDRESRW